jgi:hypothetical protein
MGAGAGRFPQHGLEAGVGVHSVRLAGLQRGDARGASRARIAQPPRRRRGVERLDDELQGRLGALHGL